MSDIKSFLEIVANYESNNLPKPAKRKYKEIRERFPVKVYHIDKDLNLVFFDFISSPAGETPIFEQSYLPKYLMEYLKVGDCALVCITRQTSLMQINVLWGEEVVDASLFNTDHLWADLEK